jgi:hypothetical protein
VVGQRLFDELAKAMDADEDRREKVLRQVAELADATTTLVDAASRLPLCQLQPVVGQGTSIAATFILDDNENMECFRTRAFVGRVAEDAPALPPPTCGFALRCSHTTSISCCACCLPTATISSWPRQGRPHALPPEVRKAQIIAPRHDAEAFLID